MTRYEGTKGGYRQEVVFRADKISEDGYIGLAEKRVISIVLFFLLMPLGTYFLQAGAYFGACDHGAEFQNYTPLK